LTLFSDVVGVISNTMQSLQVPVKISVKRIVDNGTGDPTVTVKKYDGIVEKKTRQVRDSSGTLVGSSTNVTFTVPVDVIATDEVYLPDGSGGPIISISAPYDQSGALIKQVYLG
jgi:hypothetical protein